MIAIMPSMAATHHVRKNLLDARRRDVDTEVLRRGEADLARGQAGGRALTVGVNFFVVMRALRGLLPAAFRGLGSAGRVSCSSRAASLDSTGPSTRSRTISQGAVFGDAQAQCLGRIGVGHPVADALRVDVVHRFAVPGSGDCSVTYLPPSMKMVAVPLICLIPTVILSGVVSAGAGRRAPLSWAPDRRRSRSHVQHKVGSSGRVRILSGSSGSGEEYTRSGILTTRLGTTAGGATRPCDWVARSAVAVVAFTWATPSGSTT